MPLLPAWAGTTRRFGLMTRQCTRKSVFCLFVFLVGEKGDCDTEEAPIPEAPLVLLRARCKAPIHETSVLSPIRRLVKRGIELTTPGFEVQRLTARPYARYLANRSTICPGLIWRLVD